MNTGSFKKACLFFTFQTLFFLFFSLNIYSDQYTDAQKATIIALAKKTFWKMKDPVFGHIPGLKKLLEGSDRGNYGKYLELETALYYFLMNNCEISGLNLDIKPSGSRFGYLADGKSVTLKGVEFDVVTDDGVCECKSTGKLEHEKTSKVKFFKNEIKQFTKERSMLAWLTQVCREIDANKCVHKLNVERGVCRLCLKGPCTKNKKVYLQSSWIDGQTLEECATQWATLLGMLYDQALNVVFKSPVPDDSPLGEKLTADGFTYIGALALPERFFKQANIVHNDMYDGEESDHE